MNHLDRFLKQNDNGSKSGSESEYKGAEWKIPEYFNIANECVRQHALSNIAENIALIVEDDLLGTIELSYKQLDIQSGKIVSVLNQLDIAIGDRVLIRLPNSTDYPESFFASAFRLDP